MIYIRFESVKIGKPITEKQWLEALLSIPSLRPISKERIAQLSALGGDDTPLLGDAEILQPDGRWLYSLQWISSLGTALLSAPDEVRHEDHWLRPIIVALAKRLDAVALDDDEIHYEGSE